MHASPLTALPFDAAKKIVNVLAMSCATSNIYTVSLNIKSTETPILQTAAFFDINEVPHLFGHHQSGNMTYPIRAKRFEPTTST